ncbi:MAG: HEPN domain-containing protein [Thermoplasmatota archaeon]
MRLDVQQWFSRAEGDLLSARILLAHDELMAPTGVHVEQAIEKALKGFLISRGWKLRKTHDCSVLLNEALVHDTSRTSSSTGRCARW